MTEKHLKNYYQIFIDCWQLFKKYSNPVDNDEFWKSMTEEANDLYTKHGKVNFSERMISAVMQEVENIYKEQVHGNKS